MMMMMMMTKEQIVKFIHKFSPEINVKLYRGKNHRYRTFGGYYAYDTSTIFLNERIIFDGDKCQRSKLYITQLVMHELGHHHTYHTSIVEREYKAQRWAIKTAEKLNMKKIAKNLKLNFENWTPKYFGKNYGWNSCYRRYYLARKLAKKRKLIY